jgi:hypothetical protein
MDVFTPKEEQVAARGHRKSDIAKIQAHDLDIIAPNLEKLIIFVCVRGV